MITIITALAPAFAIMFIFTRELPLMFKYMCYKLPNWLLSVIISISIIGPLAGWVIGPLALFLGEFVVYPWLVIDKKITGGQVAMLKDADMWPLKINDNHKEKIKQAYSIVTGIKEE